MNRLHYLKKGSKKSNDIKTTNRIERYSSLPTTSQKKQRLDVVSTDWKMIRLIKKLKCSWTGAFSTTNRNNSAKVLTIQRQALTINNRSATPNIQGKASASHTTSLKPAFIIIFSLNSQNFSITVIHSISFPIPWRVDFFHMIPPQFPPYQRQGVKDLKLQKSSHLRVIQI